MDHRATDTSKINVSLERKIPLSWVLGVAGSVTFTLSVGFASWAWNMSLTLNNVGRDVVLIGKTLEKVEQSQKEATAELNKGINRDIITEGKVADIDRRLTLIEAKQATRQQP